MEYVGYVAAILTFVSFYMRSLTHLRLIAVLANICFISYALLGIQHEIFGRVLPIMLLHLALLPLNLYRLRQAQKSNLPNTKYQIPNTKCNCSMQENNL